MVYRMYHIYDRSFLACAIPSIATAGLFAIGCGLTNQLGNMNTPAGFKAFDNWSAACYSVTLFNSFFMSVAIGLRLWKVYRETAEVGMTAKDSVVLRAMRVLTESAALWTFSVSLNFFSFLAKTNLKYTFLNLTSPTIGISFCLIIVRLGMTAPEVREDGWGSSQRSRVSRMMPIFASQPSTLPVSLDRVKRERHNSIDESESGVMELRAINSIPPTEKQAPVPGEY